MKNTIILVYFIRVCLDFGLAETETTEAVFVEVQGSDYNDEDFIINNAIDSTLYRTVKRYFCSVQGRNESELLVYGTREWSFPAQDVTLNLDYPDKDNSYSIQYLVTEVVVIVHFEGTRSAGFITSGGMMRDHISMMFVFTNITRLSYQFYVYGSPQQSLQSFISVCRSVC